MTIRWKLLPLLVAFGTGLMASAGASQITWTSSSPSAQDGGTTQPANASAALFTKRGRSRSLELSFVPGVDASYDDLRVEYPIMLQEDLNEIFRPGHVIDAVLNVQGGAIGTVSCEKRARDCHFNTPMQDNSVGFVMSELNTEFYFSITSMRSQGLDLNARLAQLVKGESGYLYLIDYTYAKPTIMMKLIEQGYLFDDM